MPAKTLETREFFHLEFLRRLVRAVPPSSFAVKGGCNLRFFFGSDRYSEDIDIDLAGVAVHELRDKVMSILESAGLSDTARSFGIDRVRPPDIARAKQTETVQRFKVHLITAAGEDLPAKIEFSRRGLDGPVRAEPILSTVLSAYRMAPLIVPHYTAEAATRQKVRALLTRRHPEARDVFDLFVLGSRTDAMKAGLGTVFSADELHQVRERIYEIDYERYRDTVVSFLSPDGQDIYDKSAVWDQIRLVAIDLIERELVER